jgi:hypothetical protein
MKKQKKIQNFEKNFLENKKSLESKKQKKQNRIFKKPENSESENTLAVP